MTSEELREALAVAVGDRSRVSDGDSERDLHASDISFHRPARPDVVVYATSTGDVSAVLALADGLGIPVTPFGAGSSLEALHTMELVYRIYCADPDWAARFGLALPAT